MMMMIRRRRKMEGTSILTIRSVGSFPLSEVETTTDKENVRTRELF